MRRPHIILYYIVEDKMEIGKKLKQHLLFCTTMSHFLDLPEVSKPSAGKFLVKISTGTCILNNVNESATLHTSYSEYDLVWYKIAVCGCVSVRICSSSG